MVESTKAFIKRLPNKMLVADINKIRKEKADPAKYGKYGTSRWVTTSEFWRGHHADLKAELKKRQDKGLISKQVGRVRRRANVGARSGLEYLGLR